MQARLSIPSARRAGSRGHDVIPRKALGRTRRVREPPSAGASPSRCASRLSPPLMAIPGYTVTIQSVSWLSTLAGSKIRIELLQAGGADSVREVRVGVVRGEHGVPRPPAVSPLEPRAGATQYEEIEQWQLEGQPSRGTRCRRPQRQSFLPRSLEPGHVRALAFWVNLRTPCRVRRVLFPPAPSGVTSRVAPHEVGAILSSAVTGVNGFRRYPQ